MQKAEAISKADATIRSLIEHQPQFVPVANIYHAHSAKAVADFLEGLRTRLIEMYEKDPDAQG